MKDSKKYSPKITKLFKSLKVKSAKYKMPQYDDPIEAVVFGLISEHVTEAASGRMYKRMMKHFVNLNDLRVSRREEILEVFGSSFQAAENVAASVTQVLNAIFEKNECGDRFYPEFSRCYRIVINIALGEFYLFAKSLRQLFHHGSDGFAGAAPGGPEIHQNGFVGLQHFRVKAAIFDFHDTFAHNRVSFHFKVVIPENIMI